MKRWLSVLIVFCFFFVLQADVIAKGGFSAGRSVSRSISKSSGFTGSSKSSSSSVKSGSSSAGKASTSVNTGTRSFTGVAGSSASKTTAKSAAIQDYYTKSASTKSYNTYKQNLNPEQKKVYDDSMKRVYSPPVKYDVQTGVNTRPTRVSTFESQRPVIVNVNRSYYGGPFSYGSARVGIWDMWFLMHASNMFWYSHWNDISPYRSSFDQAQFAQMEARVRALEAQNVQRDPNYIEPGVDPDMQFSDEYISQNAGKFYSAPPDTGWSFSTKLIVFLLLLLFVILFVRWLVKRRRKRLENLGDKDSVLPVINPLNVGKDSIIEFSTGVLANKGIYKFKNIIEMDAGGKLYARYDVYSASEDENYIFDVFPTKNAGKESYLYGLIHTEAFSEDFLNVVGQKFMTTPSGNEFQRVIMPDDEERIDGVLIKGKTYDLEGASVSDVNVVESWEYQRDVDGITKYLQVEKNEDSGVFSIFEGEMIEDIFYKVYTGKK